MIQPLSIQSDLEMTRGANRCSREFSRNPCKSAHLRSFPHNSLFFCIARKDAQMELRPLRAEQAAVRGRLAVRPVLASRTLVRRKSAKTTCSRCAGRGAGIGGENDGADGQKLPGERKCASDGPRHATRGKGNGKERKRPFARECGPGCDSVGNASSRPALAGGADGRGSRGPKTRGIFSFAWICSAHVVRLVSASLRRFSPCSGCHCGACRSGGRRSLSRRTYRSAVVDPGAATAMSSPHPRTPVGSSAQSCAHKLAQSWLRPRALASVVNDHRL